MTVAECDTILHGNDTAAKKLALRELGKTGKIDAIAPLLFLLSQRAIVDQYRRTEYTKELAEEALAALSALIKTLSLPVDAGELVDLVCSPFYQVKYFDDRWEALLPVFRVLLLYPDLYRTFYSVVSGWLAEKNDPKAVDVIFDALHAQRDNPEDIIPYYISRAAGETADPRALSHFLDELNTSVNPSVVHWNLELIAGILRQSAERCEIADLLRLVSLRAEAAEVIDVSDNPAFDSHEYTGRNLPVDTSAIRRLATEELKRRNKA